MNGTGVQCGVTSIRNGLELDAFGQGLSDDGRGVSDGVLALTRSVDDGLKQFSSVGIQTSPSPSLGSDSAVFSLCGHQSSVSSDTSSSGVVSSSSDEGETGREEEPRSLAECLTIFKSGVS